MKKISLTFSPHSSMDAFLIFLFSMHAHTLDQNNQNNHGPNHDVDHEEESQGSNKEVIFFICFNFAFKIIKKDRYVVLD